MFRTEIFSAMATCRHTLGLYCFELSSTKTVSEHDMDIKTLFHNLREEVSCSVCSDIFTDPKHLPCLHSFCLHCLKQWHTTSHGRDTIKCPKCQAISRIPESGDLKDLPTSFYLNGLIDVLAIKECRKIHVKCGNCQKKSYETSYCFQCCIFYCQACATAHNIMRSNKDHRVLSLKDFQDKDYEHVLKRPVFCAIQGHTEEELKFFCKDCEMAVCQTCVLLEHKSHTVNLLQKEAETQKIQMKSIVETQKNNLKAKMNIIRQLDEDCAKIIQQGEDVKRDVQKIVDNLIAVIEAKKQNIFSAVENQTSKSLESLIKRKNMIEDQIAVIELSLEEAEKLLERRTNTEVVQLKKSLESIFEGVNQAEPTDSDPKRPLVRLTFMENQKLLNLVNTEELGSLKMPYQTKASHCIVEGIVLKEATVGGKTQFLLTTRSAQGRRGYNKHDRVTVEIRDEQGRECAPKVQISDNKDGSYKFSYSPKEQERHNVTVKVNGRHVLGSPFTVKVQPFQVKAVLSFGTKGPYDGMFSYPWGVAVNGRDEIAVTDHENNRVQIFFSDGNLLRSLGSIGRKGNKKGEFNCPTGIAFHKNGNIFVVDRDNFRIQIFNWEGEYLRGNVH